jgi:hypothetical protein
MSDFNLQIKNALSKKLKDKVNVKKIKNKDLKDAGKDGVSIIKKLVSKGISPIKGEQRYPGYKKPDSYPGDRKKRRPVNLKLSGKFLKQLVFKTRTGRNASIRIGFFRDYGKTLEQGHREGANTQPKRPIIPTGDQEFKPQIINAIKKRIVLALKKSFK